MILKRKKLILITTFIIVTALAIVLCVGYFTKNMENEFDGTLVDNSNQSYSYNQKF